jgi:dTMP kinase
MKPQINLIWAQSRNGVIGKNNAVPWHSPEDLAHFKSTTAGCPVIMGRKTWDSLQPRFRPLPGRKNIVITSNKEWVETGATAACSLDAALDACGDAPQVWVIGGAQIYELALPLAQRVVVTEIDDYVVGGDTFAPTLSPLEWQKTPTTRWVISDDGLSMAFVEYKRIPKETQVQGLFITFEGIDGAGKSGHIQPLAEEVEARGRNVIVTREPGGTALAEKLRTLVLNDTMDPLTEALLVFAARRDHLQQVIEPALARGDVVICDRFTDSTFAYQGHGRGFDLGILTQLERWVQDVRQPDVTFWFDLKPEVAAARLAGARTPDRFESQSVTFFRDVASGYLSRMHGDPARFIRIDADQPAEKVFADILASRLNLDY